ncbi:MAG TPA: sulfatase, partial [Phycisphaerae bacterium]|nr:sulfatase [Phycisphaerae bacterium]
MVALIGSLLIGLGECGAACALSLRHYGDPHWPWMLMVASAGKAVISHVVVWCPLFALLGVAVGWGLRRRAVHAPEAIFGAVFMLLAAWVIAPCDLTLAERYSGGKAVMLGVAGTLLAAAWFGAVWWWTRRRGRRFPLRVLRVAGGAALVATLVLFVVFVRSPMFDPGAFRVAAGRAVASPAGQPNVLWIVMDTVRRDHTSLGGYDRKTTPHLDEFAQRALVFDHAVANGMWTLPNHAAMFSGLPLRAHGTDFPHPRLDARFATVAETLRDHGYATAAFSNNPWVAPATDVTRGFDTKRILYHLRHINRTSIGWMLDRLGWAPPLPWFDEDFGGAMTNALVADWVDNHARRDQPMFVFVNYMDAHLPYRVPRRYRAEFLAPPQVRRSYELSLSAYGRIVDALDRRFNFEDSTFLPESDREVLRGQYDAGIRYVDDRVDELIDMFRQRGLLDDTLVVI